MRRKFVIAIVVVALLASMPWVVTLIPGHTAPAGPTPMARIDPSLSETLEASAAPTTFEVIVTFRDSADMALLDAVAPNTKLWALPSAYAHLTAAQIETVASWPEVVSVWDALEKNEILLEQGRELVQANRVHSELGITGEGVVVAVVDTGIDATHSDLATQVVENYEVVGFNSLGLRGCVFVASSNTDDDGHGTHVSGTIAGTGAASDGRFTGVAPGARLVGYSTNVGIFILTASALCAYDDIIRRTTEPDPERVRVHAVSNSWGGGAGVNYDPASPISVAIQQAHQAGIVSVFAAGNDGPDDNTMTGRFSVSPYVIGVGAITKPQQLVMFSSRGRPFDNQDRSVGLASNTGVYRPAVAAPGVRITAPTTLGGYESLSGTSMATPHVSGVVALIRSANPDLTPLQVVSVLEGTASALGGYFAHEVGAGLANAYGAVTLARDLAADPSTPIPPGNFVREPPPISRVDPKDFPAVEMVGSSTTAEPGRAEVVADHFVTVEADAIRLYVDIEWILDSHNFYLFLYRPGVDPGEPLVFPSQEAVGLLDAPLVFRFADVRNPEPGDWRIRILARVNTVDVVFTTAQIAYGATSPPPDQLGVTLTAKNAEKQVKPGDDVAYALRLTNTGTLTTIFRLEASGVPEGWQASVRPAEVTLVPGQTVLVRLIVVAPDSAQRGDAADISVTATSVPAEAGGPTVSAVVSTRTTVKG